MAAYYQRYGGLVVSSAINRFFYAVIDVDGEADIQITSSDYGTFYQHRADRPLFWEQGDLTLPKAIVHHFGVVRGLKLFLASEVPPGTGLGSSSAVAVALVKGLGVLAGRRMGAEEVAQTACQIEIEKVGLPIGVQDQYAAAYGGFNAITFEADGVRVEPLRLAPGTERELQARLMLFFTHSSRNSADILQEQRAQAEQSEGQVVEALHHIKALALRTRSALEEGDVDEVGQLLDESWQFKKRLSARVSSSAIDGYYALATKNGALGGKITGAGGGGFLMLLSAAGAQDRLTQAMEAAGLYRMDFRLEASGAHILMNSGLELGASLLNLGQAA